MLFDHCFFWRKLLLALEKAGRIILNSASFWYKTLTSLLLIHNKSECFEYLDCLLSDILLQGILMSAE